MESIEKRIEALEGALEIWSRRWGWALSEHSLNEAEREILKIERQLKTLRASSERTAS